MGGPRCIGSKIITKKAEIHTSSMQPSQSWSLELGSLGEDQIYPHGEKVDTAFQGQEQTVMDEITGEEHRRAE